MARTDEEKMDRQQSRIRDLAVQTRSMTAELAAAQAQLSSAQSERESLRRQLEIYRGGGKTGLPTRVAVNFGGATLAVAPYAVLDSLLEYAADKLGPDSWLSKDLYLYKGLPHALLGLLGFVAAQYGVNGKPPSKGRQFFSSMALVFGGVGLYNIATWLRLRISDGKADRQNDALRAQKLQEAYDLAQQEIAQLRSQAQAAPAPAANPTSYYPQS
ncbi:MAG: hypothetical protein U1A78_26630 [Polyangia bacterium]